ncbi:MAG: caspase family protein [Pyrinomonadaceae bacterium]
MKLIIRNFALIFPLSLLVWAIPAAAQTNMREPFVLEMPEVTALRYTSPVIRVSAKDVPMLRFRILEPFAENIDYGAIVVTINGDGANRGCDKRRDAEGKYMTCQRSADRKWGYDLNLGKNVIEIRATDKSRRDFYASYVLILGDKQAPDDTPEWKNEQAKTFRGRKYAVVVGISDYFFTDAGLKNLSYADDDARAVADFLKTPQGGRFSSSDIKLLLNKDATLGSVRGALEETFRKARAEDLIFIFIAGHGAPDPLATQNIYFLLSDTKVVDMGRTGFLMSDLKQMLDTEVAAERVIVMIDTCHSAGVNQKTKSLVSGRDLVQESDENNISNFYLTKQLFSETGRAILTSSDINEVSQESPKWGNHGVFTWALLNGLGGKADYNRDKLITMGELFQYTRSAVQKETNFKQNPRALPGSNKDLTLAITGGS